MEMPSKLKSNDSFKNIREEGELEGRGGLESVLSDNTTAAALDQTNHHSSMDSRGIHKALPLAEELLTVNKC